MILHLIKATGLPDRLLSPCLDTLRPGDAVVLFEADNDFFTATAPRLATLSQDCPCYFLPPTEYRQTMPEPPPLPTFVKTLSLQAFVDLTSQYPKAQSWF